MCLEIKKGQRAKIAKEDIKCYKVIKCKMRFNWVTFYKEMIVNPGIKYRSDIVVERSNFNTKIINKALHSFTSGTCAIMFLDERIESFNRPLYKIIQCIIPKGAKYYIGEFDNPDDSYASDVLIYPDKF